MLDLIATLLQFVPLGVAALVILVSFLTGFFRGFKLTLIRALTIVGEALAGVLLAKLITPLISSALTGLAFDLLKNASFAQDFGIEDFSSLEAPLSALIAAALNAFVFLACFIVLDIIVRIVFRIVTRTARKGARHRLFGGLAGIGVGFIVAVLALMPFAGTVNLAQTAADSMEKEEDFNREAVESFLEFTDATRSSVALNVAQSCGGWLYDLIAEVKTEDGNAPLKEEVRTTVSVVMDLSRLARDVKLYTRTQVTALRDAADASGRSLLLPELESTAISAMAAQFNENGKLLGSTTDFGEYLSPLMEKLFEILAGCDKTTVAGDVNTFADMLEVLVDYHVLADLGSSDATLTNVTQDGFRTDMETALNKNPRFAPLVPELYRTGMRVVAAAIDTDAILAENPECFDEVAEALSGLLQSTSSKEELVDSVLSMVDGAEEVEKLKEEGLDVDALAEFAADALMQEMEGKTEITGEELKDLIDKYAGELQNGDIPLPDFIH